MEGVGGGREKEERAREWGRERSRTAVGGGSEERKGEEGDRSSESTGAGREGCFNRHTSESE